MNMSPGVSTHLKWDVLYENDQPKQYKEIIYYGVDNPTNYDIGYIVGSCSSKVNEISYTHTWDEFDDNLEEYYEKSTTFGKTNECIKSSLYKFYKSDYKGDYLFEESQYRIEESFGSFNYVKNGPYKQYYETGELRGEGNYFKGEEDGPYIEYGKDGKIYKKGVYTRGRDSIDGLETRYYRNGQKQSEETYKDGNYDGLSTRWYENGQKQSEVTIKDGKQKKKKNWNEDGSVKE